MADADGLAGGPRRARSWARGAATDTITPHTRPPADDDAEHLLVRTAVCIEGSVEVELVCEPVFDYGRETAEWSLVGDDLPRGRRRRAPARRSGCGPTWRSGSRPAASAPATRCARASGCSARCRGPRASRRRPTPTMPSRGSTRPRTSGASWVGRARIPDHRWREPILRSALAIKGLTYMPTGATVAALTTSLPETPGGERNWDYRYTWMRDTTFTLQALHWLNLDWEADEFMQFVADIEANEDGALQIMYGIDGRRDLTETHARRPLRLRRRAAGAGRQRRLRPAPERRVRRRARLGAAAHAPQRAAAAAAVADRREPGRVRDARVARARPGHLGGARRAAALRLLEADVLGRARPRGQARRDPRRPRARRRRGRRPRRRSAPTSSSTASTSAACCASTTRPTRSTPRRCWRRSSGSCRRTTSGCGRACSRSSEELTEHGFVLRYKTDETDDGLSGKEGTFLICSFWLVSALAIVGELQRARDLMERLLRIASPLGLYAEEFDADTGRHLGNFPQAFSHLALIEAAARIIIAERLEELRRMSDYDVIVIGSGAGGGTLAHRLAPDRQADPAARARRLAAARARELVGARRLRRQPLRVARHVVRRRRQAVPAAGPLLRRRRDEALRRRALPPARRGLRRAAPPRRGLARVADRLRRDGAVLHRGRAAATSVHGARGEDPTEPPRERARTRSRRVVARAAHPAALRRPRGRRATTRSTRRAASCATSANMPFSTCVRCATCDGFPCLVHAKSDAEVLGVRPALEHPNVTLLTERRGRAARDRRGGHDGHRRGGRSTTAARETFTRRPRRRLVRRGQHAPQLLLASASDAHPRRAGERLRPGRAQLHVPQQPGRAGAVQGAEPDRVPEDARAQRLLLPRPRRRLPARATSRWSASRRRRCTAARSRCRRSSRRQRSLDEVARHAIDFWLSTEDLPRPENRVTLRRDGSIALALHAHQRGARSSSCYEQLQVDARPARHATTTTSSRATPT